MLCGRTLLCIGVLLAGTLAGCVQDEMEGPTHATAKEAALHATQAHRNQTGGDLEILGLFGIGMPDAPKARWAEYGASGSQRLETLEHARDGRLSRWGVIHETSTDGLPYTMTPYGLPGHHVESDIGFDHQTYPYLMEVFGNVPIDPDADWIDSDEALEQAGASNERILAFLEDGEGDLIMLLQHLRERPNPHWFIQVTPRTGGTPITTLVDAVTGAVLRTEDVYVPRDVVRMQTNLTARRGTEWSFDAQTLDRPSMSLQVVPNNSTPLHDLYEVDAHLRTPGTANTTIPLQGEWPQVMNLTLLRGITGTYTVAIDVTLVDGADDPLPDPAWPEVQIAVCFDGIRPDPLELVPRGECMGNSRAPGPR